MDDGSNSTFEMADEQAESRESGSNRTILVVEDEVLVRLPAAEYLRALGYRVLEASNAAEAVSIMGAGESIDAVFSDCDMPGRMNGIDLAFWIRRSYPDIKVLLTSGAAELINIGNTNHGDMYLLPEPYSRDSLRSRLANLIAEARL